jgi:hypothetical protein
LDAAANFEFARFRDAGFYAYVTAKGRPRITRDHDEASLAGLQGKVTLAVKGHWTLTQMSE